MINSNTTKAASLLSSLTELGAKGNFTTVSKKYPKDSGEIFSKSEVLALYKKYAGTYGFPDYSTTIAKIIRTKPIRTLSGVTPVTVLTKPYPCPGECIFCPSDIRMPKSYLSKEPGAQRAENNAFDPYLQTYSRLEAYRDMGHPYQKVELIVLGGTWSIYQETYRLWFVKRLFDALNDFGKGIDNRPKVKPLLANSLPPLTAAPGQPQLVVPEENKTYNESVKDIYDISNIPQESATWADLESVQQTNSSGQIKCVGLVLETRPDFITPNEALMLRRLGATKVQIGVQTLQDDVLKKNKRGHTCLETAKAFSLLRSLGFKIHIHWMPNLYGSTPEADKLDYGKLFSDSHYRPDEIKIYPCSLIPGTELVKYYQDGSWQPYTPNQLSDVLIHAMLHTPRYCRITRMVRDIPGHDIVVGNKLTNYRQIVEAEIKKQNHTVKDIRSREIRSEQVNFSDLKLKKTRFITPVSTEYFLEYCTSTDLIAGFLRLSLPKTAKHSILRELDKAAIIREVHVYGQALDISHKAVGKAQHAGLGAALIQKAFNLAKKYGYTKASVISAIGTKEYYRKLGFIDGKLYQHYEF